MIYKLIIKYYHKVAFYLIWMSHLQFGLIGGFDDNHRLPFQIGDPFYVFICYIGKREGHGQGIPPHDVIVINTRGF